MEKRTIETFIRKYHVGGLIEKIRWSNSNNTLKATAMTPEKKLLANVELANFNLFDGTVFGVGDTSFLKGTLSTLPENIALDLEKDAKDETRVTGVVLYDDKVKVTFNTSHLDQIDGEPKLKTIPPFETEITLTEEFVDTFNKASSAFGYDNFSLVMSKKKNRLEMVLGYGAQNISRIAIAVPGVAGKDTVKAPISFSAKALKAILAANSECPGPVLRVSEHGLAAIEFDKDGFKSQYYLIKVDIED